MKITDFVNGPLKSYSLYDISRSIPSIVDGLKITQRKALYGSFKILSDNQQIKVERLSMACAEKTSYHHGEKSMTDAIIGMNQDFVGSNNLPLFKGEGQFGNRLSHESASPRYISTSVQKYTRNIFKKEDDGILEYLEDDGCSIEPTFFYPTLPLWALNGARGVATGFATTCLPYKAKDVISALKKLINNNEKFDILPYFEGFTGDISRVEGENEKYLVQGRIIKKNSTKLVIEELPPGVTSNSYKKHLNKLIETGVIKDYDNNSTSDKWEFVIECPRKTTSNTDDWLIRTFKINSTITANLTFLDENGKIIEFETFKEALKYWLTLRLKAYEDRRVYQINQLKLEMKKVCCKIEFIRYWNENHDKLIKLNKNELREYIIHVGLVSEKEESDMLISMPIYSLNVDEIEKYLSRVDKLKNEITEMKSDTPSNIMKQELVI